jgi:hypothetical protein
MAALPTVTPSSQKRRAQSSIDMRTPIRLKHAEQMTQEKGLRGKQELTQGDYQFLDN